MAKKKGTGVSPLTNRIYYGTQDVEKHMWIIFYISRMLILSYQRSARMI